MPFWKSLRRLRKRWLRAEGEKGYRVEPSLLREPLVLIRGNRVESELKPIHRFAQSLLVTRDFVRGELAFDWFAGALLVPQIVALGNSIEALSEVSGEVDERLSAALNAKTFGDLRSDHG